MRGNDASTPFSIVSFARTSHRIYHEARSASKFDSPVLIIGETGVGKEILARYIHENSQRGTDGKFIAVNCATIPESLFESELFGHAKGSFTGADKDYAGLIEVADGGTLFLDEVEEMPAFMQVKLLRVIEQKEYRRLGETNARASNFRLICAANKDLEQLVERGQFRKDLYYRINVIHIIVPPLRDRIDEIPFFVEYFIHQFTKREVKVSVAVMERFLCHTWPGNVRELKNIIESAVLRLGDGEKTLELRHLPSNKFENCPMYNGGGMSLKEKEECFRSIVIKHAMDLNRGDYRKVMGELHVTKDMIYRAIRKFAKMDGKK
ncbi:MAG: sigma-54 interaction domain-containing protein [Bacteroidota bacterium]